MNLTGGTKKKVGGDLEVLEATGRLVRGGKKGGGDTRHPRAPLPAAPAAAWVPPKPPGVGWGSRGRPAGGGSPPGAAGGGVGAAPRAPPSQVELLLFDMH